MTPRVTSLSPHTALFRSTVQDNYTSPSEPTLNMTFTLYGATGFQVQYWNGTQWTDIPSGNVTGNNRVWRQFALSPTINTNKIRILINASHDNYRSEERRVGKERESRRE